MGSYHFYSHAREGRDAVYGDSRTFLANFYSHAREGRDVGTAGCYTQKHPDFYSHAREGRDLAGV